MVNIGDKRPIVNESNFNFTLKKQSNEENNNYVFIISKDEINAENLNLEELTLTISLHSSKLNNTIPKLLYLFSVHLLNGSENEVFRINTDHQTLRKVKFTKDTYGFKCFYLIEYDYLSDFVSLMIYAQDGEPSYNTFNIKAKYIDYEDYLFDNLDIFNLSNFDYPNPDYVQYIFLKNGFIQNDKPKSILVFVGGSTDILQFYTSFYTYYDGIYNEPSSPSLKFVPKNESLTLFAPNLLPNSVIFYYIAGQGEILSGLMKDNLSTDVISVTFILNLGNRVEEINIYDRTENNYSICFLDQRLDYFRFPSGDGNNENPNEENNNNNNLYLILGIVGGGIALIIIIIIIIVVIYRKKNKNIKDDVLKISFETERDSNLLLNESN